MLYTSGLRWFGRGMGGKCSVPAPASLGKFVPSVAWKINIWPYPVYEQSLCPLPQFTSLPLLSLSQSLKILAKFNSIWSKNSLSVWGKHLTADCLKCQGSKPPFSFWSIHGCVLPHKVGESPALGGFCVGAGFLRCLQGCVKEDGEKTQVCTVSS